MLVLGLGYDYSNVKAHTVTRWSPVGRPRRLGPPSLRHFVTQFVLPSVVVLGCGFSLSLPVCAFGLRGNPDPKLQVGSKPQVQDPKGSSRQHFYLHIKNSPCRESPPAHVCFYTIRLNTHTQLSLPRVNPGRSLLAPVTQLRRWQAATLRALVHNLARLPLRLRPRQRVPPLGRVVVAHAKHAAAPLAALFALRRRQECRAAPGAENHIPGASVLNVYALEPCAPHAGQAARAPIPPEPEADGRGSAAPVLCGQPRRALADDGRRARRGHHSRLHAVDRYDERAERLAGSGGDDGGELVHARRRGGAEHDAGRPLRTQLGEGKGRDLENRLVSSLAIGRHQLADERHRPGVGSHCGSLLGRDNGKHAGGDDERSGPGRTALCRELIEVKRRGRRRPWSLRELNHNGATRRERAL